MAALFFILIVLAAYHYYVENFFIPIMDIDLTNQLVELRDNLNLLYTKRKGNFPSQVYDHLKQSMDFTINNIEAHNLLDFHVFLKRRTDGENKESHQKSVHINSLIEQTNIPELKQIVSSYSKGIKKAFANGVIGWSIYFLPFVVLFFGAKKIFHFCRSILWKKRSDTENSISIIYRVNRYQQYEKQASPVMNTKKRMTKEYAY